MIVKRTDKPVVYPSSDGKRMAENTVQYRWIVTVKAGLDALFDHDPTVFVAGDNLIYPVEGDNKTRTAPDVYVAFGRPKGDRGSYQVWVEGGIFPQVVWEILSPGNRRGEMADKRAFYEEYGAEEYVVIDPDRHTAEVWLRDPAGRLVRVPDAAGWTSPRTGVTLVRGDPEWRVVRPDGRDFETPQEMFARAEAGRREADAERRRADANQREADAERTETARLRALLRAAGIDPDARP